MDSMVTDRDVAAQTGRRAHLYELDMLRVITAFGVVAVHVIAFTVVYNTSQVGALVQHGAEATLHFTREVFMFTTALVLVYTYVGKRFDVTTFAKKRAVGVVLPYTIWSIIYVLHAPHPNVPAQLVGLTARDLVTGDAAIQLYYILLTIQFYLLFPVLLALLPLLDRYRWRVLAASAALELVILAVDYGVLQNGPVAATPVGGWLNLFQDRFVLTYQFYFVLGALCALHLDRLRALALRNGRLIGVTSAAMLLAYWGHYAYVVGISRGGVDHATEVLQPIMVPYSLAVIAFLWWLGCRWASGGRAGAAGELAHARPWGSGVWRALADASFGIYLVHPLFISFAMDHVAPRVPAVVPEPLRVALVWVIAVAGAASLSVALMKTPIVSRLVGRDTPLPDGLRRWLGTRVQPVLDHAHRARRAILERVAIPSRPARAADTTSNAPAMSRTSPQARLPRVERFDALEQPLAGEGMETEEAVLGGG